MFWADKIAKEIIDAGIYKPYLVDDMKTPSGRIHVGSLRGVLIHELIWRALIHAGVKANFTYVFEDHDPMDEVSAQLDKEIWSKHLGKPLFTVPSPDGKAKNFAAYFSNEFEEVFRKLGCNPRIIWVSDLYKTGKMNDLIRVCLDKASVIRKIYEEMYKKKMAEDWYPFQVVCPQCGKESTTRVNNWDGEKVSFTCKVDAVVWTKGCDYTGTSSPFSGEGKFVGKLSWKVEWPVKWQVIEITIEGAGKDHMSAGGSHDVAKLVCEKVLKSPVPYAVPYEFFLIGGKKMSSSKGLGTSAKEVSEIMPPYLGRFLFTRTDYRSTLEFDPVGTMAISDLFDEYDRCWQAYNTDSDEDLVRIFELSQTEKIPEKTPKLFLPRFRDVANYIQNPTVSLENKFTEIKGSVLSTDELTILQDREKYARIWTRSYAPEEYRLHMTEKLPDEITTLSNVQKKYLGKIPDLLNKGMIADDLQLALYNLAKDMGVDSKDAFIAIYTAFLGKKHGPKAAWFLLQYPKDKVLDRLKEGSQIKTKISISDISVKTISRPDLFTIDERVKKIYPSVSVGIALIKNVKIAKTDENLEKEKMEFLESLKGKTTEDLGKYPEILSYRKLYKEMGIDWHSRRPSPEALLRRMALNKGLYAINTCVDAYNLVVMKHRVSVGAFDLDKFQLPTVLRFPQKGEEILLLGDEQPTQYKEKELAYFDRIGGYNIDFNYRDAQRTAVTESTKNLLINVDGIYDISPQQVEKSLHESVAMIVKYCGGEVEFEGIVV